MQMKHMMDSFEAKRKEKWQKRKKNEEKWKKNELKIGNK